MGKYSGNRIIIGIKREINNAKIPINYCCIQKLSISVKIQRERSGEERKGVIERRRREKGRIIGYKIAPFILIVNHFKLLFSSEPEFSWWQGERREV